LIDLLKNLGTVLGTALATIIAFYFGVRGAESAAEKAVAATKLATAKEPPKVLTTSPPPVGKEVAPDSLVSATFSEPMNSSSSRSIDLKELIAMALVVLLYSMNAYNYM
jgi:hypothetical protein